MNASPRRQKNVALFFNFCSSWLLPSQVCKSHGTDVVPFDIMTAAATPNPPAAKLKINEANFIVGALQKSRSEVGKTLDATRGWVVSASGVVISQGGGDVVGADGAGLVSCEVDGSHLDGGHGGVPGRWV